MRYDIKPELLFDAYERFEQETLDVEVFVKYASLAEKARSSGSPFVDVTLRLSDEIFAQWFLGTYGSPILVEYHKGSSFTRGRYAFSVEVDDPEEALLLLLSL